MDNVLNNHMVAIFQGGAQKSARRHPLTRARACSLQTAWQTTPRNLNWNPNALGILLLLKQRHEKVFKVIRISFSPRQSRICPGSCRTDTEINLLLQKLIKFYLPCLIQVLIATAAFGSFKVEGSKTKRMEITVKASRMHFFPLKGGKQEHILSFK